MQRVEGPMAHLPRARSGRHDAARRAAQDANEGPEGQDRVLDVTPLTDSGSTSLSPDLERELAALAGMDHLPTRPAADERGVFEPAVSAAPGGLQADFAKRVLQVAERVAVAGWVLLSLCAVLSARFRGSLPIHPIPLAAWGFGASVCAVSLAALATDAEGRGIATPVKRRVLGSLLTLLLLACASGVIANADGVAGPAWVLLIPTVVVAGAVLRPVLGLVVGALAAASLYVAAGLSHTLDAGGIGRLVILLPALPALGWAAGALAGAAHAAAEEALQRRRALERDVQVLSELLDVVASGDLTKVPSLENPADQATASLAVVFSDTLLALRRLVRQLGGVAGQLAASSTELATTATHHVGAVEQQVSAVSETTSTIEQLAATATTIAETSVRVARCAGATRHDVDAGAAAVHASTAAMTAIGERVTELNSRAQRLDERVRRIEVAARHIDELGRQTTMLAVNAAIEAARSEEAGSGFATVAAEVGHLAAKARTATGRIARIVAELHAEVEATAQVNFEGAQAIAAGLGCQADVEAALTRISDMVDRTTQATHDITLATRQQRSASDAVVSAMLNVTTASNRARSATQGHARSAEQLRDLAEAVRETVGRFRVA